MLAGCVQASLNQLELLDGQPAIADPADDRVARIMLAERDDVLCQSCLSALVKASKAQCVVAVVGESHLAGMSATLQGTMAPISQQHGSSGQQAESVIGSNGTDLGHSDKADADQSRQQPGATSSASSSGEASQAGTSGCVQTLIARRKNSGRICILPCMAQHE